MQSKIDLIYFSAPWCGPCKMMKPIIENFVKNNSTKINLINVDVDSNPVLARQNNINSVPTFLVVRNNTLVNRFNGMINLNVLNSILN